MRGIENRGHDACAALTLSAPGFQADVHTIEFVLEAAAGIEEAILKRIQRNVDDEIRILRLRGARARADLILAVRPRRAATFRSPSRTYRPRGRSPESRPWPFRQGCRRRRWHRRWLRRKRCLRQISSCGLRHSPGARRRVRAGPAPALGSTCAGCMLRRAEISSSCSTLPCSTRTSRSVSPGEVRRRC